MSISIEKTVQLYSKCKEFIAYTGSISENLSLDQMSVRVVFDRALLKDEALISQLENKEIVVSISEIEKQFPGTVQLLSQIADWLNPDNQNRLDSE